MKPDINGCMPSLAMASPAQVRLHALQSALTMKAAHSTAGWQHHLAQLLDRPRSQHIPQLHLALGVPGQDVPLVVQDSQRHQPCSHTNSSRQQCLVNSHQHHLGSPEPTHNSSLLQAANAQEAMPSGLALLLKGPISPSSITHQHFRPRLKAQQAAEQLMALYQCQQGTLLLLPVMHSPPGDPGMVTAEASSGSSEPGPGS